MPLNLLENFLLGFAITAVPGAFFFETVRRTSAPKSSVTLFLIGGFAGMFLIITTVLLGLSVLMTYGAVSRIFFLLSGAVLMYIGLSSLVKPGQDDKSRSRHAKKTNYTDVMTGFVLATANPLSILFWMSLTGKWFQEAAGLVVVIMYSLSVVLGALALFIVLITFIRRVKSMIKPGYITLLSRDFGIIIFVYGLMTFSKAF